MASLKFGVKVMPRAEVLDTQGRAVHQTLTTMHMSVDSVRVGKFIEVSIPTAGLNDSQKEAQAMDRVKAIAKELLCNPLIEDFEIIKM